MTTPPPPPAAAPTHKTCGVCKGELPRHLFQKKEFRLQDRPPTCHNCKRLQTANRMKQKPPPSHRTRQGRVAASGQVRRPNNFGYCDYIDMMFGMKCFPELVSLGAFSSAKDISESVATLFGAIRHGNFDNDNDDGTSIANVRPAQTNKRPDILCLCIGDGCTPRTAVLACYLKGWTCVSIDPALGDEWQGPSPKNVLGLTGYQGTLAQFFADPESGPKPTAIDNDNYKHLVLLCVHSHARFVGSVTVPRVRSQYGNVATTIASLPCCPQFRHKGDIGRDPDVAYDDDCVFSAMRRVEIWNIDDDDDSFVLCKEVAVAPDPSLQEMLRSIDSPSELSPEVISAMMRSCPFYSEHLPHNDDDNYVIQSTSMEDIEEGVLSHVVSVSIEYAPPFRNFHMPEGLVIKFLRPDAPQHRMFSTEGNFYSSANDVLRRDVIPFRIPTPIYTSSTCIALERMVGRSMKLVDGCHDLRDAENCVRLLATMHARSWVGSNDDADGRREKYGDLDPTPGVGLALEGLAKERRFVSYHARYLDLYANSASDDNAIDDEDARGRLKSLCGKLCLFRLRDIHDRVANYRPCLIHGDFHVANLIFADDYESPPALIDWATCGRGNPIFDLVFFLLVSGEDDEYTTGLLQLYYRTLLDEGTSDNAKTIQGRFPIYDGSFLGMYRNTVLNEFLILVAYDELARQFVEAADTPSIRNERALHFRNVARRCMMALLAVEPFIDWPALKSEDDRREEEIAFADGGGNNIEIAL